MAKDVSFQMPDMLGAGLEPSTEDAFGSVGGAIEDLVQQINRAIRRSSIVYIPGKGKVPLDKFGTEFLPWPGVIWAFEGTFSEAQGRRGWAICDGTNGTPDLRDQFVRGASANCDSGATGGSDTHSHALDTGAGMGGPDDTIIGPGCECVSGHEAASNSHVHSVDAFSITSGSTLPAYYSVLWMMKL